MPRPQSKGGPGMSMKSIDYSYYYEEKQTDA